MSLYRNPSGPRSFSHLLPQVRQLLCKCHGGWKASELGPLGYSWTRRLWQTPPTVIPTDGTREKKQWKQLLRSNIPLIFIWNVSLTLVKSNPLNGQKKSVWKEMANTPLLNTEWFTVTNEEAVVSVSKGCFLSFPIRMFSSSASRSWVQPRLKTSVPRWADAGRKEWKL